MSDQRLLLRRGRRRLAAMILMLAAFLCWWNWPRGDQRFVGRWNVSDELEPDRVLSTLILNSNGSGTWEFDTGPCLFGWRVSSESLDLGPRTPSSLRPAAEAVSQLIYRLTNRYLFVDLDDYELLSVTPNEIVIASNSVMNARRQILRRVRD